MRGRGRSWDEGRGRSWDEGAGARGGSRVVWESGNVEECMEGGEKFENVFWTVAAAAIGDSQRLSRDLKKNGKMSSS